MIIADEKDNGMLHWRTQKEAVCLLLQSGTSRLISNRVICTGRPKLFPFADWRMVLVFCYFLPNQTSVNYFLFIYTFVLFKNQKLF